MAHTDDIASGPSIIRFNPKPIPTAAFDWDFWHDDYDGAPDAWRGAHDPRCGSAASAAACLAEIAEIEAEMAHDLAARRKALRDALAGSLAAGA